MAAMSAMEMGSRDVRLALWARRLVRRYFVGMLFFGVMAYFTWTAVQAKDEAHRTLREVALFVQSDSDLRGHRAVASGDLGEKGIGLAFCGTAACASQYVLLSAQARILNARADELVSAQWAGIARKICGCDDPGSG